MSIMTYTRPAYCKDCKFSDDMYKGKRKLTKCTNPESIQHEKQIRLKDRVCDKWKLIYT